MDLFNNLDDESAPLPPREVDANPVPIDCTDYLSSVFMCPNQFAQLVESLCISIEPMVLNKAFDFIAFRGVSGAALAFPISYKLRIPIVVIRKPHDSNHSCRQIEGARFYHSAKYLIVDDIVSTGATVNKITKTLQGHHCIGVMLYDAYIDRSDAQKAIYRCTEGQHLPVFTPMSVFNS